MLKMTFISFFLDLNFYMYTKKTNFAFLKK